MRRVREEIDQLDRLNHVLELFAVGLLFSVCTVSLPFVGVIAGLSGPAIWVWGSWRARDMEVPDRARHLFDLLTFTSIILLVLSVGAALAEWIGGTAVSDDLGVQLTGGVAFLACAGVGIGLFAVALVHVLDAWGAEGPARSWRSSIRFCVYAAAAVVVASVVAGVGWATDDETMADVGILGAGVLAFAVVVRLFVCGVVTRRWIYARSDTLTGKSQPAPANH